MESNKLLDGILCQLLYSNKFHLNSRRSTLLIIFVHHTVRMNWSTTLEIESITKMLRLQQCNTWGDMMAWLPDRLLSWSILYKQLVSPTSVLKMFQENWQNEKHWLVTSWCLNITAPQCVSCLLLGYLFFLRCAWPRTNIGLVNSVNSCSAAQPKVRVKYALRINPITLLKARLGQNAKSHGDLFWVPPRASR